MDAVSAVRRAAVASGGELLEEVHRQEQRTFAAAEVDEGAVDKVLEWAGLNPRARNATHETREEYFERIFPDEEGLRMVRQLKARKGMGPDAFDAYLLRLAPHEVQLRFVRMLREVLVRREYPRAWHESMSGSLCWT